MGGCSLESFEDELKSSLTENILKNCQSDLPCGETCTKNLLKLSEHPCYHVSWLNQIKSSYQNIHVIM